MLYPIYESSVLIKETLGQYNLQEELEDLIVAIYGVSDKAFDKEAYIQLVAHLKESCDYAIMNMNSACLFAALLLIRYEYPFSKVLKLRDTISQVRSAGFRSRVSNHMAFILLEEEGVDDYLAKAMDTYHRMQSVHGIITGEDDYLSAVFLSELEVEGDELIDLTESNYKAMSNHCFKKGNALQGLSHLVTYLAKGEDQVFLESICHIHRQCMDSKIKLNSSQFVLYGLLAFCYQLEDHDFMPYLDETIAQFKKKVDRKRLRTLQMNVIVIEALKTYYGEKGHDYKQLSSEDRKSIQIILIQLTLNYLFRERLL